MPKSGFLGDNVTLFCTASLIKNINNLTIEFDYGFTNNSEIAVAGYNQTNTATISPVTLSSAGDYNCTVTVYVTVSENGSDLFHQTNTSNTIQLSVQRELFFPLHLLPSVCTQFYFFYLSIVLCIFSMYILEQ